MCAPRISVRLILSRFFKGLGPAAIPRWKLAAPSVAREIYLLGLRVITPLIAPKRNRDGGSSPLSTTAEGEDANGGRGMINYGVEGCQSRHPAGARDRKRWKKKRRVRANSSERRDGQDRRRALANCALKWWKIGERARAHDEISEPSDIYGSSQWDGRAPSILNSVEYFSRVNVRETDRQVTLHVVQMTTPTKFYSTDA